MARPERLPARVRTRCRGRLDFFVLPEHGEDAVDAGAELVEVRRALGVSAELDVAFCLEDLTDDVQIARVLGRGRAELRHAGHVANDHQDLADLPGVVGPIQLSDEGLHAEAHLQGRPHRRHGVRPHVRSAEEELDAVGPEDLLRAQDR
jgi:hypothetical protein